MTRYEQGFMNKCAEYGVDGQAFLEKQARIKPRTLDDVVSLIRKWSTRLAKRCIEQGR